MYRFESPLIYANADAFANAARGLVDAADPPTRVLVVDCEVVFGIDYTGTKALTGLIDDMRDQGVEVRLARVHGPALEKLRTSGVLETLGEDKVFLHVEQATETAQSRGNGKLRPTRVAPKVAPSEAGGVIVALPFFSKNTRRTILHPVPRANLVHVGIQLLEDREIMRYG